MKKILGIVVLELNKNILNRSKNYNERCIDEVDNLFLKIIVKVRRFVIFNKQMLRPHRNIL